MKTKILVVIYFFIHSCIAYSQQNFCSDSSFRIKYIFDNKGAILYNNPDTTGKNIFTGTYFNGLNYTIALLKTTWGDSMIWAKKISANGKDITCFNNYSTPDGSFICSGVWGAVNSQEFLVNKIDTNGTIKWIKRFRVNQSITQVGGGFRNISIANNAIYFNVSFNNISNVVVKLDLDGNIIWSREFWMNLPNKNGFAGAPLFFNNTVIVLGINYFSSSSAEGIMTITKLNDGDGSLIESLSYKTQADASVINALPQYIKYNTDNSFTITGNMSIPLFGSVAPSNIIFNSLLDGNLNPVHNYYYKNNIPLYSVYGIDFNDKKQHAFIGIDLFKLNDKYFITFGKDDEVRRCRKFVIPANYPTTSTYSVNLDNKENLHYIFHYDQNNKLVTEYARISNFAPTGTLGCFGKDTSILTRYPFTLTKEPFVWDNIQSNVIVSNDVPYTEDTAIVTKELVCKIVSRCDSVHINGPAAACVGVPVRYTVSKNIGCFKNLDWLIDTTVANIVNLEGDSAITLNFKKTFTGYIHAALTDCVVKDSFLVTAVVPKMLPLINRKDSLLCPGKTLVLTASNGYTNYQWQGNTSGQQFTVSSAGVYTVTALDSCGIAKADSIRVTLADTSLTVPSTQTVCLYDTAFITLPADVNNITWQPTANSFLNNKTLLFYPQQTTLYNITAERTPNCGILKTTVVVIKTCPQTVFIPNAFTPNKNNVNDIFKPSISQPLAFYRLQIFNRYGQTIFETSNQSAGWDGTFKGSRQPMGGYIYQCSYRFAGGVQKMAKGYFILVR